MDFQATKDCRNCFKGLARVRFDRIYHQNLPILSYYDRRSPKEAKRITDLARRLDIEGWQRANHHNFADVVVGVGSIETLNLPREIPDFVDETLPCLDVQAKCLHGLSRLLAAYETFQDEEGWWVARVFTQSIEEEEQIIISEQYAHEAAALDGLIFRSIRLYHRKQDRAGEDRWWSRLTESKHRDLKQLFKNERLTAAFDALLEWPGLWYPIRLGCLSRLLTMKCDEELLSYLDQISQTWKAILSGLKGCSNMIDEKTVLNLETLVPGVSSEDRRTCKDLISSGELFGGGLDTEQAGILERNLLGIRGMIPSLFTFFELLKYLEPCAKIMRTIADTKLHGSVQRALWNSYRQPAQMTIEYAENDVRPHPSSTIDDDRLLGYQQLWLFTLRHFAEMGEGIIRKESRHPKSTSKVPNHVIWQAFGTLACRLGFHSSKARQLRDSDGAQKLVMDFLKQHLVEPNSKLTEVLTHLLRRAGHRRAGAHEMEMSSTSRIPKERRCGRPYSSDQEMDAPGLFVPTIFDAANDRHCSHVSSFRCRRETIMAFLCRQSVTTKFDAAPQERDAELTDQPLELVNIQDHRTSLQDTNSRERDLCEKLSALQREADALRSRQQDSQVEQELKAENAALRMSLVEAREGLYEATEKARVDKEKHDEEARVWKDRRDGLAKQLEMSQRHERAGEIDQQALQRREHQDADSSQLQYIRQNAADPRVSAFVHLAKESGDLILINTHKEPLRVPKASAEQELKKHATAGNHRYYLGDYRHWRSGMKAFPADQTSKLVQAWKDLGVLIVTGEDEAWKIDQIQRHAITGTKRKYTDDADISGGPAKQLRIRD